MISNSQSIIYNDGNIELNDEKAEEYFKLAADKGHAEAAFNYAKMTNSIDYFLVAAERGVKDAFYNASRFCLINNDADKSF